MKTAKYIIYGFIVLFLAGTIGVRLYITKISPSGPPIPGKPQYKNIEKVKETSKIEEYEQEIEEKRKERFAEKIPDAEEIVKVKFNEVIHHTVSTDENRNKIITRTDETHQQSSKNKSAQKSFIAQKNHTERNDNSIITIIKHENEPPVTAGKTESTVPTDPFGTLVSEGYHIKTENEFSQASASLFLSEIFGTQEIRDNSAVILRLKDPIRTADTDIPANSKLYGVASFWNSRFRIRISYAKTPNGEIPVNMAVYDNDKTEGLYFKSEMEKAINQEGRDIAEEYIETNSRLLDDAARAVNRGVFREKRSSVKKPDGYRVFVKIL
jgi:hypothetical protein